MKTLWTTLTWMAFGVIGPMANAHVVFAEPHAIAGSYFKATLRVGHGCGNASTTSLTVKIPAGFESAKPQPKLGWNLTIKKESLAKPYISHGKTITEDVVEITWQATNPDFFLPNEQFEEFSFLTHLPSQPGLYWANVRQVCVKGSNNWTEVPASGSSTQGLQLPAALIELLPPPEHHHH